MFPRHRHLLISCKLHPSGRLPPCFAFLLAVTPVTGPSKLAGAAHHDQGRAPRPPAQPCVSCMPERYKTHLVHCVAEAAMWLPEASAAPWGLVHRLCALLSISTENCSSPVYFSRALRLKCPMHPASIRRGTRSEGRGRVVPALGQFGRREPFLCSSTPPNSPSGTGREVLPRRLNIWAVSGG